LEHAAGKKEILTIYANTPHIGSPANPVIVYMSPLSALTWTDGTGAKIPGGKNNLYFKGEIGKSVYDES